MIFASWRPLGRALGGLLGRLGGLLGRLEAILEASWVILVAWVGFLGTSWQGSWRPLGASWRPFGPSGGHLGPSWRHLGLSGRLWWPPRSALGAILGVLDALESARSVSGRRQSLGKRGRCSPLSASRRVGGPLEDYRNPARQPLAFSHASTRRRGGGSWGIRGSIGAIRAKGGGPVTPPSPPELRDGGMGV